MKSIQYIMNKLFIIGVVLLFSTLTSFSQRRVDKLDRGVVAVRNSAGQYYVSWRLLTSDPDDVKFNLYSKNPVNQAVAKLNTDPLTYTNFQSTIGQIINGSEVFVKTIINEVESSESIPFKVKAAGFNLYRSAYLDITFNPAVDGLELHKFSTKFVWPADLDGDGEYDYVVDRVSTDGGTDRVQGYLRDGTLLWTINPGPNVPICRGSSDMVTAYDMDGDGKAEVLLKSSDGTQFANGLGVKGSSSLDTDNDGIINYELQSSKNPPMYITVIDGMTGNEKTSIEFNYSKTIYTRTNKSDFMGEEYNKLTGHMGILYTDGKHPDLGYIYMVRTTAGNHIYYVSAWGYNASGQFVEKYTWARGNTDAAEAHGLRVADVDFDGRDEMLDIGYGVKYDGTLTFNAHLSHGDRFRTGDIDPTRPGLETFAIQQNAGDMLGMILYDAGTGSPIKKWYMNAVGDVGRGECMDVDSTRIGFEMWSTMGNIYDAKGGVLYEGGAPWPYEGIWWDGDLVRETMAASDGNGFNADIRKYDINSHSWASRLIEFAKMTSWQVHSEYGVRPAFVGDMIGDWREEIILEKRGSVTIDGTAYEICPGIVGFSTDYPTSQKMYCLMENPAYRLQCTARGYYQSSFPDFYLGHGMTKAPVPPVMSTKLTWNQGALDKSSASWLLSDEKTSTTFTDGDDLMFDISGKSTTISLNETLAPSRVYAMNPLGKNYVLSGTGKFTGSMDFIKSMKGNFTLNGNHDYTGLTRISEGTLTLNGSLAGPALINSQGTLAGNATINGALSIEKALHLEGGRVAPGSGWEKIGKITVNNNLELAGGRNLHFDFSAAALTGDGTMTVLGNDSLIINGFLKLSGTNNIIINSSINTLPAGSWTLIQWSDSIIGGISNFKIQGISGLPVKLAIEGKSLKLIVNAVRESSNVEWTGAENSTWNYEGKNFNSEYGATHFVSGDTVSITDEAVNKAITLSEKFILGGLKVSNNSSTIKISGTGGISGEGGLHKTGKGLLNIETVNNDYTGATILENARLQVAALNDAGTPGSLGIADATPSNISLTDSRLIVYATSTNTNRGMTLIGQDTLDISKSGSTTTLTGTITGSGSLIKTGVGQLNLSNAVANTYKGGTTISQGTISLGSISMNNSGLGTGPVTLMNGAKLNMYYSTGYGQHSSWDLRIPEGSTATLVTSGRCDINGSISGAGTLNYYVSYVRTDLVAGGADMTGKINVTTDSDGGEFRITTNNIGFPSAQINLNDKVGMSAYSSIGSSSSSSTTVVKVGSLSGSTGATLGTGNWVVGSDNRDAVFTGTIVSTATITKVGTGNWTLSGNNAIANPININAGTITVANLSLSATGTATVNVKNSATLAGTGIAGGGVTVSAGGAIAPGTKTAVGLINFGNSVVLNSGSKLFIKVSNTSNDKISVKSTLLLKGSIEMQHIGNGWEVGKEYIIFTAGTLSATPESIIPEKPAANMVWNLSKISEGIISVDLADGLFSNSANKLKVYPAIVLDNCTIESGDLNGRVQVDITNISGQSVFFSTEDTNSEKINLNLSQLSAGMYIVKMIDNSGKIYSSKIIKK